MELTKKVYAQTSDGQEVDQYTISNSKGITVKLITYGGTLTNILMPDKKGKMDDIILGFDTLEGYQAAGQPYFGATVGRFANRIGKGQFQLDGKSYQLALNDGGINHLHGGNKGFDKVIWNGEGFENADNGGVVLTYRSPDGEEGYPGNLQVKVIFTLNDANELKIEYFAEADKKTPVNLTNHAYWNLTGDGSKTVKEHQLYLNCPQYLLVNDALIPNGKIQDTDKGVMDFTAAKLIGKDLLQIAGGYDHCYVIKRDQEPLSLAAKLYEPVSGRALEVFTTKPAIQFYSGNFLDGSLIGRGGVPYQQYTGLCLETQYYPDAVNHSHFPNVILSPGQKYHHVTVHRLTVE